MEQEDDALVNLGKRSLDEVDEVPNGKRKKTSNVWIYFAKINGKNVCQITKCGKAYKTAVTSTLQRHIANHTEEEIMNYNLGRARFLEIPVEERIANWVIRSLVPFRSIDCDEFRYFFTEMIPSRKAIKALIIDLKKEKKFNQFF